MALHSPLQCSCLENPRGGGAWWAAVYGVTQSRIRLKRLSSSSSSMALHIVYLVNVPHEFENNFYSALYACSNSINVRSNWLIVLFKSSVWVQFGSVSQSCPTLCDPMNCSTPGLLVHHQLPELTQTHVHWVGDAIQPSHPLSSPSPPALSLSQHQSLFKWVTSSHQVAKVLEFQLTIIPSNEHPGLISFRMNWLDLLAVQGTLKSLQHHSSKASILWRSAFFTVQLSHPCMTTGKNSLD